MRPAPLPREVHETLLAEAGLDLRGAEELAGRTSRVWRVEETVVRATPLPDAPSSETIEAGKQLGEAGVGVGPLTQHTTSTHLITTYPWIRASRASTWEDVGHALRRLHALAPLALPRARLSGPGQTTRRRVEEYEALTQKTRRGPTPEEGETLELLLRGLEHLEDADDALEEVPHSVVHQDGRPANVIVDEGGNPLLIDLDGLALCAPQVDLLHAHNQASRREMETFNEAYGYDITTWDLLPTILRARHTAHCAWLGLKTLREPEHEPDLREDLRLLKDLLRGT